MMSVWTVRVMVSISAQPRTRCTRLYNYTHKHTHGTPQAMCMRDTFIQHTPRPKGVLQWLFPHRPLQRPLCVLLRSFRAETTCTHTRTAQRSHTTQHNTTKPNSNNRQQNNNHNKPTYHRLMMDWRLQHLQRVCCVLNVAVASGLWEDKRMLLRVSPR